MIAVRRVKYSKRPKRIRVGHVKVRKSTEAPRAENPGDEDANARAPRPAKKKQWERE